MTSAVAQTEQQWPWWLTLINGIALVILGILLFMNPVATWTTLVWVLGIYWIIIGIIKLISMFQDHSKWGWKLVLGVLYIIAGVFLIGSPLLGGLVTAASVVLVIGIYAIIIGIMGLIAAFQGAGWGAGILGVITAILGLWLLFNVKEGILGLPWALGILCLIGGVVAVVQAFRQR